jgi:hypothetical protein
MDSYSCRCVSIRGVRKVLWLVGVFWACSVAFAGRLGDFESHADVGSPARPGAARFDPDSRDYSLEASGVNMWAQRDEFHFAWRKIKGDFILQARVEFIGAGRSAF